MFPTNARKYDNEKCKTADDIYDSEKCQTAEDISGRRATNEEQDFTCRSGIIMASI